MDGWTSTTKRSFMKAGSKAVVAQEQNHLCNEESEGQGSDHKEGAEKGRESEEKLPEDLDSAMTIFGTLFCRRCLVHTFLLNDFKLFLSSGTTHIYQMAI